MSDQSHELAFLLGIWFVRDFLQREEDGGGCLLDRSQPYQHRNQFHGILLFSDASDLPVIITADLRESLRVCLKSQLLRRFFGGIELYPLPRGVVNHY